MEKAVTLRFPLRIENVAQEFSVLTSITRKENVVSFVLPFSLNLSAENGVLKTRDAYEASFIYVFMFADLNGAKEFVGSPVLEVLDEADVDCTALEEEMSSFMAEYETNEKRKDTRTKVYDDDGFYEYQ